MQDSKKRRGSLNEGSSSSKKKKPWRTAKKGNRSTRPSIEPGDAGIWATCAMGKEGKSTSDLRDLFEDYASNVYGDSASSLEHSKDRSDGSEHGEDDDAIEDIEASISAEVRDLKSASTKQASLFQAVKIDVQCVLFFKTRPPVEPVAFVRRICEDVDEGKTVNKCRFVKRLTPMSRMGKATMGGLEDLYRHVLPPVFGGVDNGAKKFAIRPTIRNNSSISRDCVIKSVAAAVGSGHIVDLTNPDVFILVDIYRVCLLFFAYRPNGQEGKGLTGEKNKLGIGVVGSDYEKLKRYNLAEINDKARKAPTTSETGVEIG